MVLSGGSNRRFRLWRGAWPWRGAWLWRGGVALVKAQLGEGLGCDEGAWLRRGRGWDKAWLG